MSYSLNSLNLVKKAVAKRITMGVMHRDTGSLEISSFDPKVVEIMKQRPLALDIPL